MCIYSDDSGYKCPHENLEDNDYCIFHLQDDNKDVDEFNKGIKEILETEKDSINFHGFYFPPVTSDFSAQNFKTKIEFFNVIFSEEADFYGATFSEDTEFSYAIFSKETHFIEATFLGKGNFSVATSYFPHISKPL
jgi:pentapeptide repeat protein